MSEKKKLKLEDLKIQSFVTSLKKDNKDKIKGGVTVLWPCTLTCSEDIRTCDPLDCRPVSDNDDDCIF